MILGTNTEKYLIASYPRSGSTWLRFILCNIFYPEIEHSFDSVNRLIPGLDNKDNMRECEENCIFYKTHSLRFGQNVIYLYRHVGDVLISEYWYKKKFNDMPFTMEEWFEDNDYGVNWRASVNHYFPCKIQLSYKKLNDVNSYTWLNVPDEKIQEAIEKSSFKIMQEQEEKGFGIYDIGNKEIRFVREGRYGQFLDTPTKIQQKIIEKNYTELKILGYQL